MHEVGYLNFGGALAALKKGRRVARRGWNGKGMFLFLVDSCEWSVDAESLVSYRGGVGKAPWIGMKTAGDELVPWLASQTDILAEDWEIIDG
jgi:hypothetical protein